MLAATVLATASASGVLFLSSVGSGALHNEVSQQCPEAADPAIATTQDPRKLTTPQRTPAGLASGDRSVRTALHDGGYRHRTAWSPHPCPCARRGRSG
jgi:hypothetical protein